MLVSIGVGPARARQSRGVQRVETHQKRSYRAFRLGRDCSSGSEPGSFYGAPRLVQQQVWIAARGAVRCETPGSDGNAPSARRRGAFEARPVGLGHSPFLNSGTLAYVPGGSEFSAARQIVWVDRQGVEQLTSAPTRQYNGPKLSPDGERVAVVIQIPPWSGRISGSTICSAAFCHPSPPRASISAPCGRRMGRASFTRGAANSTKRSSCRRQSIAAGHPRQSRARRTG